MGDGEKYYLAETNLSALLQKISSNHKDFYCLNCFNSYATKNKLKEHEEICNNNNSCHIEMPDWVNNILKHNPGEESFKNHLRFILIYNVYQKNCNPTIIIIIIISKNHIQKKKLDMSLLVGQCL